MAKGLVVVLDLSWKGEYPMTIQALRESGFDVDSAIVVPDANINYRYDLFTEADKYELDKLVQDYDLVAIVGGYRMYYIVTEKKFPSRKLETQINMQALETIVKAAAASNRTIVAPLAVPAYLAKLGLLRGRKATVYPTTDLIQLLEQNGVSFVNAPAVKDGNYVTMKKMIVEELKKCLTST